MKHFLSALCALFFSVNLMAAAGDVVFYTVDADGVSLDKHVVTPTNNWTFGIDSFGNFTMTNPVATIDRAHGGFGQDMSAVTGIPVFNGSFSTTFASAGSTNVGSTLVMRDISGNFVAGSITAALTGNASTATALATGRTISITGDVAYTSPSFTGSGNITAAGTLATVNSNVGSFTNASVTVNAKGLITAVSNGTAAASANTASTIVLRDGSGNFSAGTITASLTGNASTSTTWATGRTISMTGDVAYTSASLNGSGNVTGAGTLATVNSNVGSFTNANVTVNAKGLVTAASNGSGGGGGASWLIKTTNYTATAGDKINADSRSGTFTITLPASPSNGDTIEINDATNSWNTSNVTVSASVAINSGGSSYTLDVSGDRVIAVYNTALSGWYIH